MSYDTLDVCEDAVRQRLKREMVLIKITPLSGPASNTRPIATYSALWPIKRLKLYLRGECRHVYFARADPTCDRRSLLRSPCESYFACERNLTLAAAALHGSDRRVPAA